MMRVKCLYLRSNHDRMSDALAFTTIHLVLDTESFLIICCSCTEVIPKKCTSEMSMAKMRRTCKSNDEMGMPTMLNLCKETGTIIKYCYSLVDIHCPLHGYSSFFCSLKTTIPNLKPQVQKINLMVILKRW